MKNSAGILLYRNKENLEVFLVHPGGPFWKNKDNGSWSIPKGEFEDGENAYDGAVRELAEETGIILTEEEYKKIFFLRSVIYPNGKKVFGFAVEKDASNNITSNIIKIEYPPKSGKFIEIPEIDRGEWFDINQAKSKILKGQIELLNSLKNKLNKE